MLDSSNGRRGRKPILTREMFLVFQYGVKASWIVIIVFRYFMDTEDWYFCGRHNVGGMIRDHPLNVGVGTFQEQFVRVLQGIRTKSSGGQTPSVHCKQPICYAYVLVWECCGLLCYLNLFGRTHCC